MELYELCKTLFLDWLLFGIIEAWILCLFFERFASCSNFNISQIFMISILNTIVSTTITPPLFQIIFILYMGFFISLKSGENLKVSCKYSAFSIGMMSLLEIPYGVIVGYLALSEMVLFGDHVTRFIIIIPVKMLEIVLILYVYNRKNK